MVLHLYSQEDTDLLTPVTTNQYSVTVENGQNVITLGATAITTGQILQVNFRSDTPVGVRAEYRQSIR